MRDVSRYQNEKRDRLIAKLDRIEAGDMRLRDEITCLSYGMLGLAKKNRALRVQIEEAKKALTLISLASQDSGTTKQDIGREARAAAARLTAEPEEDDA